VAEVSVHPDAEAEYETALGWYMERSVQAADRFEAAFDGALQAIAEYPSPYPAMDSRHRYKLLRRFPYSIIYRIDGEQIRVVAVAHSKRLPGYWLARG
jgi:plasmid stabilization system protein ParE